MKLVSALLAALVFVTTAVDGADDNATAATGSATSLSSTHRSLFFVDLFRSRRQRSCVQTEPELREKLAQGGTVEICRGTTITLQAKIDMTDLSFDVQCESARSLLRLLRPRRQRQACVLSGADTTNLFEGIPKVVSFLDIEFRNGKNVKGGQEGGAILQFGGASSFERCTFAANQGTFGGALALVSESRATVRDCTFESNTASETGGAIVVSQNSVLLMSGTTLSSNTALQGGSALAAIGSGSAFIEDSVIVKGSTNQGFAALHVSGCKVTLKRTVFSENTKDILIADDDVATFVDCDATERVNFCNGKQGIEEFRGGAGTVTNTNCLVTGDVNFNAPECA